MKIAYNPKTGAALTTAPANNDITFDLRGLNIFVRGEKFKGTDTTYSVFKKHTSAGSGGYNGLVPVPSYTSTNIRFLREDGTWSIPTSLTYTELTNQDLNDYLDEGKWYYAGGGNSVTNKPSGVGAFELYVGRNSGSYRYLKLITHDSIIWFRYHTTSGWTSWVRWYTDANTDLKVLQSATTTSNFRSLILGYNHSTDKSVLANDTTNLVYTTTSIYAQPSTGSLWANKFIGKIDWSNIEGKPSSFTPAEHQHEKITHNMWGYYDAISDTTSPLDICTLFKVDASDVHAVFTGIVQASNGTRYQSLFWTGYGAAGLVELTKSYGYDGRLKYRISKGWNDNGANWSTAGYRELANVEDLTWTNIKSKPETATRWPSWNEVTEKPSTFTPSSHTHSTTLITTLTSYTKATSDSALSTSDSLNIALGKLEYKGDLGITAYNLVNAAYDGDGTIENLKEILKVLEGIKDTETIKGLLGKYLPLSGGTMSLGEGLKFHSDENYFGTNLDARIISLLDGNDTVCDGGLIIDERCTYNGTTTITELLRIRDAEFKWKGLNILHSGNSNIQNGVITINGVSITPLTAHQSLANYVTLNTDQKITGVKTFYASPILTHTATITLYLNSTSNYTEVVRWLKGGTSLGTYDPSIGLHNTGGDGTGSICILPYPTEKDPLKGSVGLFIKKDHVYIDSKELANTANGSVYFTEFSGGKITSSGNALTQANHSITIGGQTRTAGASTCNIVNSLSVSTITSSAATNLTLGLTVNGVVSTNKTIPDLYAASIRVKDVRGETRLTTYWEDRTANFWFNNIGIPSSSWYSGITIKGWTDDYLTWELASTSAASLNGNLYYRNGLSGTWLNWLRIIFASELPGLFTDFSNAGSLTTSISIGGTTKTLKIDADTVDGLHSSAFLKHRGVWLLEDNHSADDIPTGMYFAYPNHGVPESWGTLVTFAYLEKAGYNLQLHGTGNNNLYYRTRSYDLGQKPWKRLANADELKDPASYYWANIPISATSSIATSPTFAIATATTSVTTPLVTSSGILTLNGTSGIYLKYNNDDASSLVLTNTYFKPFDTANNKLSLGTSSARWSNIYSVLGNFSGLIIATSGVLIGSTADIGWYLNSSRICAGINIARGVNVGSLLVSNAWADARKVPTNGIYSKGNVSSAGFVKASSSDSYVLLGGGGHKAISDFAPSGHTHLYIATTSFESSGETVADFKTSIHSTLSGKRGIGKHIVVSDSIIRNWSNNSALFTPSSVSSIININGGYDGSVYGQFLVSSWDLGLGLLKYNSSFENIQWFIHSGNIGTQSVNYANSAGNAAIASKLGTSTIGAINVPIYLNEGTPTVVNLNSTVNNLINNLSIGTSTPTDNDYYISQYVGGGTTETSYYRRPHSALYSYIKNKAEGTWNINVTGNAASATKLTSSAGNAALPIYFSDGKPVACTASSIFSNLSNDGNNISITVAGLNRTLTVNYANSAGYTKRLYANSISGLTTYPGDYSLAYSRFQAGVSNIFPTVNNANGVITAHLHYGNYFAQIGLSSDGRMYYRTMMDLTLDAGVTWNKVAWTTDIPTSLPASDVYAWAKQPTKPSYSFSEINPGVATIGDGTNRLMFRINAKYSSGMYYSTPGSESMVFANINPTTSWIFANTNPTANTDWTTLTPSLQIKNGRVTINKLISNGPNAPYNLDVNGSANATVLYENGVRVSVSGHTHNYLPLSGGTMNQGSHVVFPGTSTDASYGGSIEFREVNYVATNQTDWSYAPGITFHWGGRSVGKLGLRSDGDLAWRDLSIIHSGNISSQSVNYANSANKLNKWFNSRIEDLNLLFGDGALRIFNSISSTTANKCPSDSSILHLAWDNNNGYDSLLALDNKGNNIYFRGQNGGTWSPWKTVLHNGNSSISGNTITINGSSITVSKSGHTHSYLPLTGGTLSGNLTVGLKDANRTISIAGNTSHLKMVAHTNATYIESGNKDWNGNTPLLITGYSGNKGSNLYLYFDNIYCRSGSNSYVNLDSGNWSNYITIPTLYERNLGINGTNWTFSSPYNTAIPTIYAPTSAGTSGQVLVSNGGGAPSWKTLSLKDTDISWSTTSLLGKLSIIEMAYSNVHSSNKLAFGKVKGITLEYSQNGGSSWSELTGDAWNLKKLNLISGISASVSTGNRTTGNTANDMLRITLDAVAMNIYTLPRKLLININTNVTTLPYATVKVEYSTIGNPTSYTVYGTYNISGWSGWNSIPLTSLSTFGGASNQTSNILNIRLTFANNNANKYLTIFDIYMIGLTNWLNPSNMSKTGHLYGYNYNLDMILPASLSLGGVNNFNNKISYLGPEGYLYITANNINSNKTGGIVMKTTKNSIVSQVLLESDIDSGYGKVTITGDLCIGGRVSNTTALISSDAAHNMYISVQGKALLVCDSSENSIRRGKNLKDNITLGTTSCPWESLYVENGVKLKGKTNYFSILAPNGTHSSDEIFSLPYTGGTLVTTNSPAMVKGWATYSFSYTNGTSSTYTMTFKAGGGVNIVDSPSYYEYYKGPGILIRITSNCKDTSGGTIKDSLMVWGLASDATLSLYITKTTVLVSGSTVHYYLVYCTNTSGTALTFGSGTLNFIYF